MIELIIGHCAKKQTYPTVLQGLEPLFSISHQKSGRIRISEPDGDFYVELTQDQLPLLTKELLQVGSMNS